MHSLNLLKIDLSVDSNIKEERMEGRKRGGEGGKKGRRKERKKEGNERYRVLRSNQTKTPHFTLPAGCIRDFGWHILQTLKRISQPILSLCYRPLVHFSTHTRLAERPYTERRCPLSLRMREQGPALTPHLSFLSCPRTAACWPRAGVTMKTHSLPEVCLVHASPSNLPRGFTKPSHLLQRWRRPPT